MRIGKLENKDMLSYHQKGKVEALKAVRQKVSYLVKVLGKKLGDVILIVEDGSGSAFPVCTKQCIILRWRHRSTASVPSRRTIPCLCV